MLLLLLTEESVFSCFPRYRVYEKLAIEQYFRTKSSDQVKSPYTGEMIGKKLVLCPLIKNVIETSIENGDVSEDLQRKWNQRVEDKKLIDVLLKEAQEGDAEAMRRLGFCYREGKRGLPQDTIKAFMWLKKSHKAGCIRSTVSIGTMLFKGKETPVDLKKGAYYLTLAAGQGGGRACHFLGMCMAFGDYGIPEDKEEAMVLLQRALDDSCVAPLTTARCRSQAEAKLEELKRELASHD